MRLCLPIPQGVRKNLSATYPVATATSKTKNDARIVAHIRAITDEFECYGYRRVGAELRHRGHSVNAKKVRRLMRKHDLNPRRRRRFTYTTDSDHDGPIYPFVARRLTRWKSSWPPAWAKGR
jgi:transposase InsO family protein